jgi:predicted dehydrogenase
MTARRKTNPARRMDRRTFLTAAAAATGAALAWSPPMFAQNNAKPDPLNVGLIGLGEQCQRLAMDAVLGAELDKSENIRFKAVCDIWPYKLTLYRNRLRALKHDVTAYEDYKEMLDKEDLDAVIVATPDWMHAPITIAALNAGLHVYCEKEMSNSLDEAKKMVQAARSTGKLLQIGHQRRSNPRYLIAEEIVRKYRLAGRIKNANAQWNRPVSGHRIAVPTNEKIWIDKSTLEKYGYGSFLWPYFLGWGFCFF